MYTESNDASSTNNPIQAVALHNVNVAQSSKSNLARLVVS
jgi:hypothetical protein